MNEIFSQQSTLPEHIVYIIDDDKDVCESLSWLLQSVQIEVQIFNSAIDFLNFPLPHRPACLLLDIRMRGMSGLQLQETLIHRKLNLPIIFMTGHGDISMAVQAMRKGAFDFLEKPFNPQHMLNQVQSCLQKAEIDFVAEENKRQQRLKLNLLSPREREIIDYLVDGLPSKVIAQKLNISHKTVEIHRSNIRQKLGTESIAHIVNLVLNCRNHQPQLAF